MLRVLAWPATHRTNPYPDLLTESLRHTGLRVDDFKTTDQFDASYDILHVHWPDSALNHRSVAKSLRRSRLVLRAVKLAARRGMAVVWTAHNAHSHERFHPWLEDRFWTAFISYVHGVIVLSMAAREVISHEHSGLAPAPITYIPHGHYLDVLPPPIDRMDARASLGFAANERVLLFFGRIRPYKNVPHLVSTFASVDDDDARLVIAGKPTLAELAGEIDRRRAKDQRVDAIFGEIPLNELHRYICAADLVVLPFQTVLTSGSVLLALSCRRPVLVPSVPTFEELSSEVGAGWIQTYEGHLTSEDLREAVIVAAGDPQGAPDLQRFDWSTIGAATAAFYERVLGHPNAASSYA